MLSLDFIFLDQFLDKKIFSRCDTAEFSGLHNSSYHGLVDVACELFSHLLINGDKNGVLFLFIFFFFSLFLLCFLSAKTVVSIKKESSCCIELHFALALFIWYLAFSWMVLFCLNITSVVVCLPIIGCQTYWEEKTEPSWRWKKIQKEGMLLALNAYEGLRYLYVVFSSLFDMSYIKYHVIWLAVQDIITTDAINYFSL